MPMIAIPRRFTKFFLEYDTWNNRWQAFAMLDKMDEGVIVGQLWYRGIGANPDLASDDLIFNINTGKTIDSPRDKNRVEELQKQAKSSGHRALEKVKAEKRTYEETKKELKDLF